MNVIALDPTAGAPPEPDWTKEVPGRSKAAAAERVAASQYWGVVVRELRSVNRLALVNGHAIKRLVLAWLIYDRAAAQVARSGPVVKAPKTGTPMHSPWYTAMTQAGKTAATIEAELAITPRSRGDGDPIPTPPRPARNPYLSRSGLPSPPPPSPTNEDEPDASA
ncbi:MAG: P27 family phage terminase small subunit [Sphingomonas adhaesiva]|uniref:P27 family phage terminase small subunit n=1 Tax=Sphingomonas adhaesiva TaxID=28212 RepID=UPI002FF68051